MNKLIFRQVMKPGDWIKLIILVIVFVACWIWVDRVFNGSSGSDEYISKILAESSVGD